MRAGIYVHFPFCLKKCLYCDFNSAAAKGGDHEEYVDLLLREMELRQRSLPEQVTAPTLYFGGGTPSLMGPDLVGRLVEEAARRFGLEPGAEVTLEANPGTLSTERLSGYRAAGVNRLSLGIQSFEDRLLERLGRVHTAGEAIDSFRAARSAGFDNIGIDLMHSLPEQTPAQWRQALARAVTLAPEHLSAYALSVEEGTPFRRSLEEGELPLPAEEDAAFMFEATSDVLTAAGYRHYEISNFALPGSTSRHNLSYWSRQSYLGFGAGAHSFWNADGLGCRWKNAERVETYAAGIAAGAIVEQDRERLSVEDAVAECFFLGLRVLDGLDLAPLVARYGEPALAAHLDRAERLVEQGKLLRSGSTIRLAPDAVIVANSVFATFL